MPTPIDVFISYSHEDEALLAELEEHLAVLKRRGALRAWHARRAAAGEDLKDTIDEHLEGARIVLLLISAPYIASDYHYDVEMKRALERQRAGEATVIPVILRPCDWTPLPFAPLSALPSNHMPVTSWANRDAAWGNIVTGIYEAIASRRPLDPTPAYPDEETRRLSERLEHARARKRALQLAGADMTAVEREILDVRRQLRGGGQLKPGDALGEGRYLLLRQLGRGGFATVWEAFDRSAQEHVAIKVLHADIANDALRRDRFLRGARAMATLAHEAVVRVLDPHGEDGGFHYYVMELVRGGDLRRAVLEKRLLSEQAIPLIVRLGEGLAAAHARGLVHRDIKPSNVLIDPEGAPKLTDFDLVSVADTTGGTRTGALGSFIYAAPEMLDRPQDADARSDVFGLAMTAIFALYGAELPVTAFRGTANLVDELACGDATKAALKRATDWDPKERFADVRSFCTALAAQAAPEHRARGTALGALDAADAQLRALASRFFAAAGRQPQARPPFAFAVPEPVLIDVHRLSSARVAAFAYELGPNERGYVVHRDELPDEVREAINTTRARGNPVVTLSDRVLRAALADGNARTVLHTLTQECNAGANLFHARNALIDRRFLFGRDKLLTRIGAALTRGEHVLVTGTRKSGKTSFLNVLRQDITDRPVAVVDLQGLERSQGRWVPQLYRTLIAAYDGWGRAEWPDWPTDAASPADAEEFAAALALRHEWHAAHAPLKRMVVVLDELERVLPRPGETDAARAFIQVTGALRSMGQGGERALSIIAADLRPTANRENDLGRAGTNPFFQFFQEEPLPLLDRDAVRELVVTIGRYEGIQEVDPAFLTLLYAHSGGHPWIVRTSAGAACDQRADPARLGAADLEAGLESLDEDDTLGSFFQKNFWSPLNARERRILVAVAHGAEPGRDNAARASLRFQRLLDKRGITIGAFRDWIRAESSAAAGPRGS